MKNLFKSYFHYRKSERNGAFVLIFLSFTGLILPQFYDYFFPVNYEINISPKPLALAEAKSVNFKEEAISKPLFEEKTEVSKVLARKQTLIEFDPNTASKDLLVGLGFSQKLAQTLLNYRGKGGYFRDKEDLQKLYGLSPSFYQQLLPYIKIKATPTAYNSYKKPQFKIDINQADEQEWQKLYGIGKAYSKRIVKFRDKLGGFHQISQIAETYGLPDSTFQSIKPYLVQSSIFRPLYINQLSETQIADHPYINWKQAKTLINYRFNHGNYESVEEVKASLVFNDSILVKIKPYLNYE